MDRAAFDLLGATLPEGDRRSVPSTRDLDRTDFETAIRGLPLRLETFLAKGHGSAAWLVRTTADFSHSGEGQLLVAKIATGLADALAEFDEPTARSRFSTVLHPVFRRRLGGGRTLLVMPYLPQGSLRDLMRRTRLSQEQVRDVLRQLVEALRQFSEADASRVLVHGDIKPENVLIVSMDPLRIVVSDLDHAMWVPKESAAAHRGMLSRRYAAPEALTGLWSSTSDAWSVGMVVLELLGSRHPFEGMSDEAVRISLSGDWKFPDDLPLSDAWRAVLFGLLERHFAQRWRDSDVSRWLQGDRSQIARGLAGAIERSADTPFDLDGESIYTWRSLSRALVSDWGRGIALLSSPELRHWLAESLNASGHVVRLDRLLGDPSLDDDGRLIRFAYFSNEKLDPFWRDIRLSPAGLGRLAARALGGDGDAYGNLVALRDGSVADSYMSLGIDGPRQLIGHWQEAWRRFEDAWQRLREAGAPDARPPDESALPALVRLWVSPAERSALTERIRSQSSTVRFLLRRGWYFALGTDPTALPLEHQWILESLDRSSLVETLVYSRVSRELPGISIGDLQSVTPDQLRDAVLFSDPTERLTRNLVLDFRSREDISLLGTQHSDDVIRPNESDGFWSRLTSLFGGRLLEAWVRARERRRGRSPVQAAPEAEAARAGEQHGGGIEISAVRANLHAPVAGTDVIGQVALLRWQVPPGSRFSIHIGEVGLFGRRVTRQRISRLPLRLEGVRAANALQRLSGRRNSAALPERGQMVLALFAPSFIWLEVRPRGRWRSVRSQVLRLGARKAYLRRPVTPILKATPMLPPSRLARPEKPVLRAYVPVEPMIGLRLPPPVNLARMERPKGRVAMPMPVRSVEESNLPAGLYLGLRKAIKKRGLFYLSHRNAPALRARYHARKGG